MKMLESERPHEEHDVHGVFTLEAGRAVRLNGKPAFHVSQSIWSDTEKILTPCQLDAMARRIVRLLNADEAA